MAIKDEKVAEAPKPKQEKITFQPDKGYKAIIAKIREDRHMGPKASEADVINEYLRQGFERDGYLPKSKK